MVGGRCCDGKQVLWWEADGLVGCRGCGRIQVVW